MKELPLHLMKKLYVILSLSASVALLAVLSAHTNGPLHNSTLLRVTGAPGENTCYFCHTAFPDNIGPGSISITSSGGTNYLPGGSYNITVTVTGSTLPKYGFQMTPLKVSDNTRTGKFTPVTNTDTFLTGGRHYIEHSGANSTGVWVIPWQAPATNVGDIRFYATGVGAQFPTGTPGDYPYSTTFTISPLLPPVAGFTPPSAICIGASVQYNNTSSGATSYAWTFQGGNPPSSTAQNPLVSYLTAGTFNIQLIATNAAGSDTATGQITVHPLPDATIHDISGNNELCLDMVVQLTSVTAGGVWSGPGTSPSGLFNSTNAGPGVHSVSHCVTDVNGCTGCDTIQLTVHPDPAVTMNVTDALCADSADGAVCVQVDSGCSPYTYLWSNSSSQSCIVNVPAGSYSVTVRDCRNCAVVATATVNAPLPLTVASYAIGDASTPAHNNGSVSITPSGGTPAYTFSWSNGQTTEDIDSLYPGTYTVTITDVNGCSDTFQFTVGATGTGMAGPGSLILEVAPNPARDHVRLIGGNAVLEAELMLIEPSGRVVLATTATEQLDLSGLPPGCYLLRIVADKGIWTKSLLITR